MVRAWWRLTHPRRGRQAAETQFCGAPWPQRSGAGRTSASSPGGRRKRPCAQSPARQTSAVQAGDGRRRHLRLKAVKFQPLHKAAPAHRAQRGGGQGQGCGNRAGGCCLAPILGPSGIQPPPATPLPEAAAAEKANRRATGGTGGGNPAAAVISGVYGTDQVLADPRTGPLPDGTGRCPARVRHAADGLPKTDPVPRQSATKPAHRGHRSAAL